MSPTKVAVKRAARFNLYILAVAAMFTLYAIAKAQTDDHVPARHFPSTVEAFTGQR